MAIHSNQSTMAGYAYINGASLYYEIKGKGLPVVLIHAGLLDRRMWDEQFRVLADCYRVLRYDVRGRGLSNSPPGVYSDHHDLLELLQFLNIPKAIVVGLSLGSKIAIDFTLEHPQKVEALVLASPGLGGYEAMSEVLEANTKRMREAYERGDISLAMDYFQRSWTVGPKRNPNQVNPKIRERIRQIIMEGLGEKQGQIQQLDPPAIQRLSEIQSPILAILGELDMPEISNIIDLILEKCPNSERVVIPNAAHMVNMEAPETFNKIVLEYLDRFSEVNHEYT